MRLQIITLAGLVLTGCVTTGTTIGKAPAEVCATQIRHLDQAIMDTRLDRIDNIIAVRRATQLSTQAKASQTAGAFEQCISLTEQGFNRL